MFGVHLRAAPEKAEQVMFALSGLIPNVGGPREGRRRLLVNVVQSILLYGAPTWVSTLAYNPRGVEKLARVQRQTAIRSAYVYRKVSYDAVQVIARTPPIDLLAMKRAFTYDAKMVLFPPVDGRPSETPVTSGYPRALTTEEWAWRVARWDAPASSGREWTRTLILPCSRTDG